MRNFNSSQEHKPDVNITKYEDPASVLEFVWVLRALKTMASELFNEQTPTIFRATLIGLLGELRALIILLYGFFLPQGVAWTLEISQWPHTKIPCNSNMSQSRCSIKGICKWFRLGHLNLFWHSLRKVS